MSNHSISQSSQRFIAILEDDEGRIEAMKSCLREHFYNWSSVFFDNASDAIAWFSEHFLECDLISLDRDLGSSSWRDGQRFDPETDREVVDYLVKIKVQCPIIIHSSNYDAAVGMEVALGTSDRLFDRVIPCGDLAWIREAWLKTLNIFLNPIANLDLTEFHLPTPDASWESICEFALTFNAVQHWESLEKSMFLGRQIRQFYLSKGSLPDSLTKLRTALWFERSYWRRYGAEPDDIAMIYIQTLLDRLRDKVYRSEIDSAESHFFSSNSVKDASLIDRLRGVIFGQAVGDALGLGTEGLFKPQLAEYYPNGLQDYSQIVRDRHRSQWVCGDWTDDTDMMLCILDSLLEKEQLNLWDIALRFYHWASAGNPGIGYTIHAVIFSRYLSSVDFFQPDFDQNYYIPAKNFWETHDRQMASNGAVMRTSILGIWEYPWRDRVKSNAEKVCKITHYDPRCVGSCVAVSLAIASLLRGDTNLENLLQEMAAEVVDYHAEIAEYFQRSAMPSLEALELGIKEGMGYTLKAMSAGFWALQHAPSYADGLLQIIQEGGDADTNAAVAGAMLGARFGYQSIPKKWIDGLAYKAELEVRVDALIDLVQQMN